MTSVFLPHIGITDPGVGLAYLENFHELFVGAFLIPGGYGFEDYTPPGGWRDITLKYGQDPAEKDGSTPEVLRLIQEGSVGAAGHDAEDGMHLQFWIGIMANRHAPYKFGFIVQHVRLDELTMLLEEQIKHNIPTHTEITDFKKFAAEESIAADLAKWTPQDWEWFCSVNLSWHGGSMIIRHLNKASQAAR